MTMQISEFGPNTFSLNEQGEVPRPARAMWFKGSGFGGAVYVLVNKRIVTHVKVDDSGQLLTVELPGDLFVEEQQLRISLINTTSDERSPSIVVAIRRPRKTPGNAMAHPGTLGPKGNHVLISSFPKSGSTLLLKMLCHATGYVSWPFVYEHGENEQDLYLPAIIDAYSFNTITQQHVRATGTNLRLIKNFGLKVVVLTRNIYDTLVSLHDHLLSESPEIPMAYVNEGFARMTIQERMDFLVDIVTPWYLNFFASWSKAATLQPQGDVIWINYDNLIRDKDGEVSRVLHHFSLGNIDKPLSSMNLSDGSTRLNVGVSGRGKQFLTDAQRSRICELAQRYHKIDFSPILASCVL